MYHYKSGPLNLSESAKYLIVALITMYVFRKYVFWKILLNSSIFISFEVILNGLNE